jgi:hypothetical protein
MKGRIFRLTELLQKVDRHLRMEKQRRDPDAWNMLRLRLLRHRIRAALHRSAANRFTPRRAGDTQTAWPVLPA